VNVTRENVTAPHTSRSLVRKRGYSGLVITTLPAIALACGACAAPSQSRTGSIDSSITSAGLGKDAYFKDCNYNGLADQDDKVSGVIEDNNGNGWEDLCDLDAAARTFVQSGWRDLAQRRDTSYASVWYGRPTKLIVHYTVPLGGSAVAIVATNSETGLSTVLREDNQPAGAYLLNWMPQSADGTLAMAGRYELRATIGPKTHVKRVAWRWQ
jgi:hypothetical protein